MVGWATRQIGHTWFTRDPWLGLWISALAVGLVAIPMSLTQGELPLGGDHIKYIAMAEEPFGDDPLTRVAPASWRPLTPLLVFISPLPLKASFYLISFIGLVLASYFLYLYLRDLNFTTRYRIYGVALFATLFYAVGHNLREFYLTDPVALASIALAFLLFGRRRYLLLSIALAVAALNKEVVLLAFPAFFLIGLSRGHRNELIRNAVIIVAVFIPAAIVHTIARISIDPVNEYTFVDMAEAVFEIRFGDSVWDAPSELVRWSLLTWGVLAVLFLVDPVRRLKQVVLVRPWVSVFMVSIFIQIVFGSATERLLVYAFPVMVPIGLAMIADLSGSLSVSDLKLTLLLLVPHLLLFFMQVTLDIHTTNIGIAAAVAVLVLSWIALQALSLIRTRRGVEGAEPTRASALFADY